MFYDKHLKYIKLNEHYVSFTQLNLSYLLKDNYDVAFVKEVYSTPVVSYQELRGGNIVSDGPVRIPYHNKDQYKRTAKYLGLMDDFRVSSHAFSYCFVKQLAIYILRHLDFPGNLNFSLERSTSDCVQGSRQFLI